MQAMTQKTCEVFLSELSSKSPVPGGGGAAALVGAVGTALGGMVGSLTTGKKKYITVEADIRRLNAQAQALRLELEALVTADAEVFAPLSKAYGLPKSTPQELAYREQVMSEALDAACSVPMQIMLKCAEAIALMEEYAEKGSVLAVSDAGCGAVLCKAALQAASLNVFINTRSMSDKAHAQALNAEAEELLAVWCPRADKVYSSVAERLK